MMFVVNTLRSHVQGLFQLFPGVIKHQDSDHRYTFFFHADREDPEGYIQEDTPEHWLYPLGYKVADSTFLGSSHNKQII